LSEHEICLCLSLPPRPRGAGAAPDLAALADPAPGGFLGWLDRALARLDGGDH